MSSGFRIEAKWKSANHGAEEVRQTSAFLRIAFDGHVATSVIDSWSQSVDEEIRLSAYPLALWFASSWWRLRWEPARDAIPSVGWRMAHHMAAVGGGFLWPRLTFESDGENIEVLCRPSEPTAIEPIRYLAGFKSSVPAREFEQTVDGFVGLVLQRLTKVGERDTDLHGLWRDVLDERRDPEASLYRRLEARLGFDPEEAPETVIDELSNLSSEAGDAAISEIAPACSGLNPGRALEQVVEMARASGIEGKVESPGSLSQALKDSAYRNGLPWERGRLLARDARKAWALEMEPVSDAILSDILSMPRGTLRDEAPTPGRLRMGLAVRDEASERLALHFRKRNSPGRRFEAARFLADHLLAPAADRWLPTTDTRTARQKVQRAFAAEFLCPISALQAFLDGDISGESIEEAADHFDISPLAIRSHLANNGLLSSDAIAA